MRATSKGKVIDASSVQRYLEKKFGDDLQRVRKALVELAKRYGLYTRWAVLLAVGLGIALAVVVHLAEIQPEVAVWAQVVLGGLLLGLSASGLYSGGKAVAGK